MAERHLRAPVSLVEVHGDGGCRRFGDRVGGVDELAATGNVRVAVAEDNVEEARALISDWETSQAKAVPPPVEKRGSNPLSLIIGFIVGAIVASAFFYWQFNTPYSGNTADYNRDGHPDEWYHFRGDFLAEINMDRNHDREVDAVFFYLPREGLYRANLDNDFDGTYELNGEYAYAQPKLDRVDTDGDGHADRQYHYVDGVLAKIDMFRPSTEIIRKTQTYKNGVVLTEARFDSDNDGIVDTLIKYGPYEEEVSRSRISRE